MAYIKFKVVYKKKCHDFSWPWKDYIKLAFILNDANELVALNRGPFELKHAGESHSLEFVKIDKRYNIEQALQGIQEQVKCHQKLSAERFKSKNDSTYIQLKSKVTRMYEEERDGFVIISFMENEASTDRQTQHYQQSTAGKAACVTWKLGRCVIVATREKITDVQAAIKVDMFETKKKTEIKYDMKESYGTAQLPIPEDDKDEKSLDCTFYSLFNSVNFKEHPEVSLDLRQLKHWPVDQFVKAVLMSVIKYKTNEMIKVVFCTSSQSEHGRVIQSCESILTKRDGWIRKDENGMDHTCRDVPVRKIGINVVSGSLEQQEADVLVCTMPYNLDLHNAGSSRALLQAAGQGLQDELDKKYYKNLCVGEIAVVQGHGLRCQHVFLGIMNRYQKVQDHHRTTTIGEDNFYAVNVHDFMMTCLEKADELNAVSIVFPAVGCGNLQYPLDIVSREMFDSIYEYETKYPGTHIQHVTFVIYHNDNDTLKIFKTLETEKTSRSTKDNQLHGYDYGTTAATQSLEVRGVSSNTEGAHQGATGGVGTSEQRDEVGEVCDLLNKHSLEDSDDNKDKDRTKKQKTAHMPNTSSCPKHTFELSHPLTGDLVKFFLSDLIRKYENRDTYVCYKEKCITFQCPESGLTLALESEFKSAMNKLKQNITSDSLDVNNVAEEDIENNKYMFDEQGVFIIYDKERKQLIFHGTNWNDIQTVKQQFKMTLFPDTIPKRRNRNFGSQPNQADGLETNLSLGMAHEKNSVQGQGAKPKTKNPNNPLRNAKQIFKIRSVEVKVYKGNILDLPVGCIVNAANRSLQHDGGVACVIADAAGTKYKQESKKYIQAHGKLELGQAYSTSAGQLSYDHVIHTVGPCWSYYKPHALANVKRCERDLRMAIKSSLRCAEELEHTSIAFSAVSAGQFGCPLELCAVQYGRAVLEYIQESSSPVKKIHFVDLNPDTVTEIGKVFGVIEATGILPESYDTEQFVKPTAATVHTSHGKKGSRASWSSEDSHDNLAVALSSPGHLYPSCRPEDGLPRGEEVFTCLFSEKKKLLIYNDDILRTKKFDMIVCGENLNGKGKGYLSNKLSEIGGVPYQRKKTDEFKNAKHGDIIVCDAGGKCPCKFVAHVVLPKNADIEDAEIMTSVFKRLFTNMVKKKCHMVALPLLGTGKGKVELEYCAQMLFNGMMQFCRENAKCSLEVHLINNETYKTEKIIRTTQKCVSGTRGGHSGPLDKKGGHSGPPERPPQPKNRPQSANFGNKKPGIAQRVKQGSPHDERSSQTDKRADSQNKTSSNRFSARDSDDDDNDDYGFNSKDRCLKDNKKATKKGNLPIYDDSVSSAERIGNTEHHSDLNLSEARETIPAAGHHESEGEDCVICMGTIDNPKVLPCGHKFCTDCINTQFGYKAACPTCGAVCGKITGDQPKGSMSVYTNSHASCSGYENCGRIEITYSLPNGQQQSCHPSPGTYYRGITRRAFLPDNYRGRQILAMLDIAFKRKLVFTIGNSRTTGQQGVITWNDIHHKTDPKPHTPFGYPDPTYLDRVVDELKAKGVTEADISSSGSGPLSTRL